LLKLKRKTGIFLLLPLLIPLGGCSFDYGASSSDTKDQPDIIMREVEYVRVRDGDPTARFQAELAERYEERQTMEIRSFSFEQFNPRKDEVNALGRAGNASMELDSGNIRLENGVRIEIESEDIVIETAGLDWRDAERELAGEEGAEVNISRSDGTSFIGRGFSANARSRTGAFSGGVEGSYSQDDDEEEAGEEAGEPGAESGEPGAGEDGL
jgi:LPS export ABC transporter protein LptC